MIKRSFFIPGRFFEGVILWMLLGLLSLAQTGAAQSPKAYGIIPEFVKNNTTHNVSEVASNVLRVVNNTGKSVSFHLRFSIPVGWQMLKQNDENYNLATGDSVFVPIRLIATKQAKGNTNYVVGVFLVSDQEISFASRNWYVTIENQSQWLASTSTKKVYFVNDSDSSGFNIHFLNTGNADEQMHLAFNTDRRIDVIDPATKEPVSPNAVFSLPVGADTTLVFTVRKKKENKPSLNKKDIGERTKTTNEEYTVQALVRNEGFAGKPAQSWTGTVSFYKIGNEISVNEFKSSALPLTLEMNAYDVLSTSTTLSLDAYGNAILKNDQLLNYRFQTVFITNFLNEKTFLGNNHYLGYFSRKGSLELGEISGWGRSLISGKGIKGTVQLGSNQFGAAMARAPYFFSENKVNSYGFYHHFDSKQFNVSNYYSRIADNNLQQTNTIYNSYTSVKINKTQQLGVGGGYTTEDFHSPNFFSTRGYGYDLNYSGAFKRFFVTLTDQFGSNNYLLARGLTMYTGRTTYYVSKQFNFSLSHQNFTQQADYYFLGNLIPSRKTVNRNYEGRLGFITQSSVVYLKPTFIDEQNFSLHALTKGLGLEYNARNFANVRLSTNLFMGYVKTPDYDVPNFFVARFGATAKWNRLSLSLRYVYGPNQMAEQLRFIQNQINPQSINITSIYDHWFGKGSYLLSTNAGLMHETFFQKTTFRIKPELFYFSKSGFRFSVYATYLTSTQGSNPLLTEIQTENGGFQKITNEEFNVGFGIKKQIGVPIPGKKFKSIRVVVFKDFNGNRIQDANEDGVENILINMQLIKPMEPTTDSASLFHSHGDDFITNSKGEINYNNIPAGVYRIRIIPLAQTGDWFEGKEEEVLIDGKKTLYMPMSKGLKLSGSILVERDKYSGESVVSDLSRIRVTAIDSSGKTFSSLTDKNGNFSMYLPNGIYSVTINEAALGENYMCMENKIVVDLTKPIAGIYSITFNVVERKRKMDIKKFSTNGELKK